jgi:hypothetical protein
MVNIRLLFVFSCASVSKQRILYCDTGDNLSPPQGICNAYYGKICKEYLKDSPRVWFNNSKETEGGFENENIVAGLLKEKFEALEPKCRDVAKVSAFILQVDGDCTILPEMSFWNSSYINFSTSKFRKPPFFSFKYDSDCKTLPFYDSQAFIFRNSCASTHFHDVE